MPGDTPIYDWHHHHGLVGITHDHDNHPRHHHDKHGSVIYLDIPDDIIAGLDDDVGHGGTDAAPIGTGGYDITRRTTRTP